MTYTLTAGHYTDKSGREYEISKVSTWNGHQVGRLVMSDPASGHGWGGEISAETWALDCVRFGIAPVGGWN